MEAITDLSVLVDQNYPRKTKSFIAKVKYLLHKEINFGFNKTVKLPKLLLSIHPLTIGSRWIKSFYSFVFCFFDQYIYGGKITPILIDQLIEYDVVFSVVPSSHHLIWRNHSHFVSVNLAQDYGKGVKCIWWGDFWDFFVSSDKRNLSVAQKQFNKQTECELLGPIYYKDHYYPIDALSIPLKPMILIVPGTTGASLRFERYLVQIAIAFLDRGYHVTWKNNINKPPLFMASLTGCLRNRFILEEKGRLKNLHTYCLIVGKGSYNQISEAFLQGSPYACVKFLGYWEQHNLVICSEGAHLLDWSRCFTVPTFEELMVMKKEQIALRDQLFASPEDWRALLKNILNHQKHGKAPIFYGDKLPILHGCCSVNKKAAFFSKPCMCLFVFIAAICFFLLGVGLFLVDALSFKKRSNVNHNSN